ncbi:MAG: 2-aminoethylphosphonate--pyruvate transaminase [Planctomycetes bacterium]|nr:2-aminoethylphosphonate--pyruvate transaminase [Planctomycetota bacterium]
MKAIILAAGVGKRLAGAGEGLPKCLIPAGTQTLLERMVRSLLKLEVSPIVIVVGYRQDDLRQEIAAKLPAAGVRFAVNENYTRGNLLSAWSAREDFDDDFILMDADVLFHDEILRRLVQSRHPNAFLLDRYFENDGEATLVAGLGGRVVGFDRALRGPHDILGESVGFFRISRTLCPAFLQALRRYVDAGDLDAYYDFALTDLLKTHPFGYEDVSGLPWTEIDFPEDLERGRQEILPRIDSPLLLRRCTLLNPGPGNVTETVRRSVSDVPDVCHREREFFEVMRFVRTELVRIAGGNPATHSTVVFSGSGTAAVEAAVASAVPESGTLLVVDNGVYGDRMKKIADAHRIPCRTLKYGWTEAARPADIDAALSADPAVTHVAAVHHETTTGLLNPVHEIGQVVARHGRAFIADAMSSFAGERLDLVRDHVDFAVSSSNKCIQGLAGLSFVIARRDRLEALSGARPRSVYLDLYNQWKQEEADNTPFTPAIPIFFSLRQAIEELYRETLEGRIARYARCARALRGGMTRLGFRILVPEESRSNLLTAFLLPCGLRYDPLHDAMKRRGYVIYAGQGDLKKIAFRIANLGILTPDDMDGVVVAVRDSLAELGISTVAYDTASA